MQAAAPALDAWLAWVPISSNRRFSAANRRLRSLLNRDGRLHHDPDRFDPDRWATGYSRSEVRATFFPFGQASGTASAKGSPGPSPPCCSAQSPPAGEFDAIDAALVCLAADGDDILTSDPGDLRRLAQAAEIHVELVSV